MFFKKLKSLEEIEDYKKTLKVIKIKKIIHLKDTLIIKTAIGFLGLFCFYLVLKY